MKKITPLYNLKRWLIGVLALMMTLSCTPDIENLVGPSFSGYTIGVTAQYGGVGIVKASGSATIRIEVVTAAGVPVNGATVFLTSTLGTLTGTTGLTINGVLTTTLAAGAVAGAAYVVATVENASATTMVPILSF